MIQLCERKDCTGCGACMNVCSKHAITMKADVEGFLFPEIDSSRCVECNLCQKVCPVLSPVSKHIQADNPLAVVAQSDDIREKSSSGGMFSILAQEIFSQGGVVYGAGYREEGYHLCHQKAENESELARLRGSKYFQSEIKETYKEVKSLLKQDRVVLFTGTPCQIAGLYAYLGKTNTEYLYTADVVCHGVPSAKAFELYLKDLAKKEECSIVDIKDFSFRNLKGWDYTPSYVTAKRKVSNQPLSENLFMQLFLGSFLHRECCYNCIYATPTRVSDITLADFWGIGAEKPFGYDINKGCSLVLLNSAKGKRLFDAVSGQVHYEVRDWKEALAQNHRLRMPSYRPKQRSRVYKYIETHTGDEIHRHFYNTPLHRIKRLVVRILRVLNLR